MPLDLTLKAQIEEAFGLEIGNSYGMTESLRSRDPPGATVGRTVGVPQPGIDIRIVREDGKNAAAGEPGEIWVKGPNLMLGYYKNDLANDEVRRPGGFMTTGDIGSMDQDGNLSLVGPNQRRHYPQRNSTSTLSRLKRFYRKCRALLW